MVVIDSNACARLLVQRDATGAASFCTNERSQNTTSAALAGALSAVDLSVADSCSLNQLLHSTVLPVSLLAVFAITVARLTVDPTFLYAVGAPPTRDAVFCASL